MPIGTALLERIKTNDPTLRQLDLSYQNLNDSDIEQLVEKLAQNTTLTALNLSGNLIGDTGANAIALALKDNITLTTLDLGGNQIGAIGANTIALALKDNTALITTLNLGYNKIGDTGANAIAMALKDNATLTSLNLYNNRIGTTGANAIALALKDNATLITLNLRDNPIRNTGTKAIALALKDNTTLTSLDLFNNQIGDIGANAIILALKNNTILTTLELSCNQIEKKLTVKLQQAIKQNCEHYEQKRRQIIIIQRRDQFIQAVMTLARDSSKMDSQSLWSKLPKELRLHIMSFINFRSADSIEKSAKQIYQCAAFIFNHIPQLNASLAESLKTQQDFKIMEKTDEKGNSQFRFFPPPTQRKEPLTEKTIEPFIQFRK